MQKPIETTRPLKRKPRPRIKTPKAGLQIQSYPNSQASSVNEPAINNQFLNHLLQNQRMKKITQFLIDYKGSNFPIHYRSQYNFKQKWQTSTRNTGLYNLQMAGATGKFFWLNFIFLPLLIMQIWFVSVFRIFKFSDNSWVWVFGIITEVVMFLIRLYFLYQNIDDRQDICTQIADYCMKKQGLMHLSKIYNIIYYAVLYSNINFFSQTGQLYLLPFDLATILVLYFRIQQIYGNIKFKAIGSPYKNLMHLVDLLSNIFIMLHCFSILLFLCTYYQPSDNWLTISPLNIQYYWLTDYLTSFYFSCTTMLTVGYGDLRPTNCLEMLSIMLVQLLGISFNAYAINQIGVNLSQMRRDKQNLQRDLSNAEKLAYQNKMSNELKEKLRDQIMKNQQPNEDLEVSEEQTLMNKITQQIREQIKEENQIRIAKTCLFFTCNFSRRFQIDLSKKLVKALYPPNTTLAQPFGKERLYLITKGEVDIMTEKRYKGRSYPERILKSIKKNCSKKDEYLCEIYGVSSVFSGRPSKIKAVARSFTICYILEHSDVQECIMEGDDDFEKYHYFKNKYHLAQIPEKCEVPQIHSSKTNYLPNIFVLIKKMYKEMVGTNHRQSVVRSFNKTRKVCEKLETEEKIEISDNQSNNSQDLVDESYKKASSKKIQTANNVLKRDSASSNIDLGEGISVPKSLGMRKRYRNNQKYQELKLLRLQEKYTIAIQPQVFTQAYKQYKNYLPVGNITNVLQKINKIQKTVLNTQDSVIQKLREIRAKKSGFIPK